MTGPATKTEEGSLSPEEVERVWDALHRNMKGDNQLDIILEGDKQAVVRVAVWLLKEPRLSKIRRLAFDTEEFLDEFKGGKFQTE